MKIRKLFAALLALCCMVSMFSVAAAEETLTIGVIGPMTGGAAVYGNAVANGARIAAEEINALGGVQIVLDVQDDEHDPENFSQKVLVHRFGGLRSQKRSQYAGSRHDADNPKIDVPLLKMHRYGSACGE